MNEMIIGAGGMVGIALARILPNAARCSRPEVDLTDYSTMVHAFDKYRPRVVYLAAAYTNVDGCEDETTDKVNIQGPLTILRLCEQFETKLVYFSSSYVFDGKSKWPYTPEQDVHPIQNYGVQKAVIENYIRDSYAKWVIVRTVGVFGRENGHKNFAKSVVNSIFQKKKVHAPDDQFMNPLLSDDLARAAVRLGDKYNGLFHVAGDTCMSKYEFAVKVASQFGLENLVVPVSTKEMKQQALRPRMGCLDSYCLEEIGFTVPSFESGMVRFLEMEMV